MHIWADLSIGFPFRVIQLSGVLDLELIVSRLRVVKATEILSRVMDTKH
jgi:hypothetical protein